MDRSRHNYICISQSTLSEISYPSKILSAAYRAHYLLQALSEKTLTGIDNEAPSGSVSDFHPMLPLTVSYERSARINIAGAVLEGGKQ